MPRKKAPREGETTFDAYTQACRGRKRQWRREVLPELALWLSVLAERVANSLAHATQMAKDYGTDDTKSTCTRLRTRLDFLAELLMQLPDPWSEVVWFANVPHVAEVLASWKPQDATPPQEGTPST